MTRIRSPKNPNCYIDCPNDGWAVFREPLGPCLTGCDSASLVDNLVSMARAARATSEFGAGPVISGEIVVSRVGAMWRLPRRAGRWGRVMAFVPNKKGGAVALRFKSMPVKVVLEAIQRSGAVELGVATKRLLRLNVEPD